MGESKDCIVLNRMYAGAYLSTNLGHEVINMFQADNGKHYLYLNAKGNFDKQGENVGYMLLVMYAGENCLEILALAKDLKPLSSAQCSLSRNYNKLVKKISGEQRNYILNQAKNEEGESGGIHYGGAPLLELFSDADQQNIFISYEVGIDEDKKPLFFTPKDKIFLYFDKDNKDSKHENKQNNVFILTHHNLGTTTLHQYIEAGNNDYETIKKLIDDSTLWEQSCSKVSLDSFVSHGISLIDICEIQNNENCFSNALRYFMLKYPQLWKDFLEFQIKENYKEHEIGAIKNVEREVNTKVKDKEWKEKFSKEKNITGGRIDILIYAENANIIIENKIDSDIIVDKIKGNIKKTTQLDRYYNYVKFLADKKDEIYAFVLTPNYNSQQSNNLGYFKEITYSDICSHLEKDVNWKIVKKDSDFLAFYHAIRRHSHKSKSLSRYEDMKHTFFSRIEEYKNRVNC